MEQCVPKNSGIFNFAETGALSPDSDFMEKRELIERRIEACSHLGQWMRQCAADSDWQNAVRGSLAVNGFFTSIIAKTKCPSFKNEMSQRS